MHTRSLVLTAIFTSAFALTLTPGGTAVATAATECLAAPNGAAPEGQQWRYRTDHQTQQKCWFLRDATVTGSVETSPEASPSQATSPTTSGQASSAPGRTQAVARAGTQPRSGQAPETPEDAAPAPRRRTAQSADPAQPSERAPSRSDKALFQEFLRWYKVHGGGAQ